MKRDKQARLWKAINDYVRACGGDPNEHIYENPARCAAVVDVEDVVFGYGSTPRRRRAAP